MVITESSGREYSGGCFSCAVELASRNSFLVALLLEHSGAGFTLGNLLKGSASRQLSWIIGAVLIAVGILAFGYGWYGYKKVHDYIERSYRKRIVDTQPFQFSMTSVTAITIILIVASLLAFFLMLT